MRGQANIIGGLLSEDNGVLPYGVSIPEGADVVGGVETCTSLSTCTLNSTEPLNDDDSADNTSTTGDGNVFFPGAVSSGLSTSLTTAAGV